MVITFGTNILTIYWRSMFNIIIMLDDFYSDDTLERFLEFPGRPLDPGGPAMGTV